MTLWILIDIALAVLFAYLAHLKRRNRKYPEMWFCRFVTVGWLGFAAGQWFRANPGSWPFW